VTDRIVTVEHRHRKEDPTELPDPEENRGRLGRRRQDDRDTIAALDAVLAQQMRRPVCEILELSPCQLAIRAVEALPDHRELFARMLVADIRSDVVVRGHIPAVTRADLLIGGRVHWRMEGAWHLSWRGTSRRECGLRRARSCDQRLADHDPVSLAGGAAVDVPCTLVVATMVLVEPRWCE